MKLRVADKELVNLNQSLLHEEVGEIKGLENVTGELQITGVAAFDSEMKILPLISDYLSYSLRYNKISETTAKTYGNNLIYFLEYLKKSILFKDDKLDESFLYVQEHIILEYFVHLQNDLKLSSQTIRNRDLTFQSFFNEYLCADIANKQAKRTDNPYEDGFLSGTPKSNLPEMCQLDDLILLMRCTSYERERIILQFIYDSGARRSEVSRVTKKHIEDALNSNSQNLIEDDETMVIPSNYKRLYIAGSKGRKRNIKPRHTIVSTATLKRIKRYFTTPLYKKCSRKFGSSSPAFLNAHGNQYNTSAIGKLFERLSKRAIKRNYIEETIHPHMLRHGFAGAVLRSPDLGNDAVERLVILQLCLGHNQLSTTEIYTSVPYDVYGTIVSKDGEIMCRYEIMEKLVLKTKLKIRLEDKK